MLPYLAAGGEEQFSLLINVITSLNAFQWISNTEKQIISFRKEK